MYWYVCCHAVIRLARKTIIAFVFVIVNFVVLSRQCMFLQWLIKDGMMT